MTASTTVLPLPLTCFEEWMFWDDRPGHPMTGIFRMRFSGHLQRPAFETAVARTVARHPLLRATVCCPRRGRPYWVDHTDWLPTVQWSANQNDFGFPHAGHIDITQGPGTRFWVVDGDDGNDVILQIHHACTDALGASRVMEDLLVAYAQETGTSDHSPPLRELDEARLTDRGKPGLTLWRCARMIHHQAVGLLGVRKFLLRRPIPLVSTQVALDESVNPSLFPSPYVVELDRDETSRLLACAKSLRVTVNDLLVRDAFLAIGGWRKEHGLGPSRDWLRLMIPISLLRNGDGAMPMANSLSAIFLDRRGCDFEDADRLLQSIVRQIQCTKRHQLQYTYILSLAVSRCGPGGLRRQTRADKCRSSCCFSNLGVVLDDVPLPRRDGRLVAGDVVLDSIDFVIPIRPHMHAAFCVYTYAGRLRMLMHFDPRVLSRDISRRLVDGLAKQLRSTISTSDAPRLD
ncbi:MAG: hypothetical protein H8E44_13455 [Planctomycetes bacterium]|nr:hypothetical protein [Planctomycetota bacterium]MBL7039142.1 hypothetical protein [Pirellulaceae bacterium]